jgi:GT2 family glycosyltransferase
MMNRPISPISDADLPPIAIGVLGYNRRDNVLTTLEILRRIDYPRDRMTLIVIDNGSTDGTAEAVAESFGGEVEVLRLRENIGAVARNRVMLGREEPYIFVFDEDCAPERPDTIRRIVEFMESNHYFGALCFRSINFYTQSTEYGEFAAVSRRRLENGACEGMYVIGNGMCFRRDAIRRAGGYDERFFWGAEEYELGLGMLYHNAPIAFHPDFALIHRHAPRAFSATGATQMFLRNNIWISFKYFPLPLAVVVAFLHTLRPFLTGVLKRRAGVPRAVLEGAWEGVKTLSQIFPTRKPIPVSRLAQHNRWFMHMFYYLHPQKSQLMQEQEGRDAESVQALQRFLDARAARCGDGGIVAVSTEASSVDRVVPR